MPVDLTPKVIKSFDDVKLTATGGAKETTVVRFLVGELGPFEISVPRDADQATILAAMQAKANSFVGLV